MMLKFFGEILSRGFSLKRHVRSFIIILMFPSAQELNAMLDGNEAIDAVELFLVGAMTALHLAVFLRPTNPRLAMGDAEIIKVPAEVA